MAVKFYEEFEKASGGNFPMLKFNSALYLKDKRELTVRFIISAFKIRAFDADKQKKVDAVLAAMFPGVKASAQYIRTYADANVVKNKIVEYFNKHNQIAFRLLRDDCFEINVSDSELDIVLHADTPLYKMLNSDGSAEALKEYLDFNFNQAIEVRLKERPADESGETGEADFSIDTVAAGSGTARLINITLGEKIYARGKTAGISQLPNYITDVKGAAENVIFCGKASNFSRKNYKNKKYDASDPKSGPEELPLIRFILNDTTAKIECVCFPRPEEADAIENIGELAQIVAAGRVSLSTYNGALSFTPNAIFRCEIDFDSIRLTSVKPVPEKYETVEPEAYSEFSQGSVFDEESEVPKHLMDRTYVIFDFEATDINPLNAEPIELAAAKMENGRVTQIFRTLIRPRSPIPPVITQLTSIDDEMVVSAPEFSKVLPDFYKFTRGSTLVGHNIGGYDYPLLAKYASEEGYNFDNDLEDTLLLSRSLMPDLRNHKLETITKAFGINHDNAHRALADVLATAELLRLLAKRMQTSR